VRQTIKLTGVGFLALVLGALIYVAVRPEGSSYLSKIFSFPVAESIHVPFINNLPSFFHVLGFSLLTLAVLGGRKYVLVNCLTWLTVNLLFEVGQHAHIQHFLVNNTVLPKLLETYFQHGTFDVLDITFCSFGALAAYCVIGFKGKVRGEADV
jgi:hypothetical protein